MFATTTLAARIEIAEARLAADFGEAARGRGKDVLIEPIGGTVAVYGGPGEPFNKVVGGTPGCVFYLARRAGNVAGCGMVRLSDGLAQLGGASTLPAERRRGVQSALLRARLADAAASGADLAVVTTEPASKSQQNVQRAGFALLYARAILRRMPKA